MIGMNEINWRSVTSRWSQKNGSWQILDVSLNIVRHFPIQFNVLAGVYALLNYIISKKSVFFSPDNKLSLSSSSQKKSKENPPTVLF